MQKKTKTTKMTIDKLAIMVAKGFDRMATKDDIKNMATKSDIKNMATKDDIKDMATKKDLKIQGDVLQIMLKEMKAIHEDSKSLRENIATLYTDHVAYDRRIDNLAVRVEKLETK
jgi:hypothetical protein